MERRQPARGQIIAAALSFVMLTGFLPARAWDAAGHEIVAALTLEHLNAKARAAVDQAAQQISSPNHPYNAVTLACWMDDLRLDDPSMPCHGLFRAWHFIDLGVEAGDPQPSLEPGNDNPWSGNAVQALKRCVVVLKGGTDPYVTSQAMACALAMHLVGDLHQPLHASSHYFFSHGQLQSDAGGNRELVDNGPADERRFNLHMFWDSAYRAGFDDAGRVVLDPRFRELGGHDPAVIGEIAEDVAATLPPDSDFEPDIEGWARESNAIARDFVYREITPNGSPKYCRLSSSYVAKANHIARERLALAARRLAVLLNETVGAATPGPPPPAYPAGPPGQPY